VDSQRPSVLITGCSKGGIGHALALAYHEHGLRVFATARRLESMPELVKLGIHTFELDVCEDESIKKALEWVSGQTGGSLDVLVNNAGQSYVLPATDYELAKIKKLFDVNVFGVMNMCHTTIPLLRASTYRGGARIINVGSVVGIMPAPFEAAYNASKAAIHSYGDSLRVELDPFNIKVITVITGGVRSNITINNHVDLPEDSLYDLMRDLFYERRVGRSQKGPWPAGAYALKVVQQSLRSSPPAQIWAGKYCWRTWLLWTFGWHTIWDRILSYTFGLGIFKARLEAAKLKPA